MRGWSLLACLLCVPAWAHANCIVLDFAPGGQGWHEFIYDAASLAVGKKLTMHSLSGYSVEFCSPEGDITGLLSSESLQAAAQAMLVAHQADNAAREADVAEARAEMKTNTLCDAAPAMLNARIDAEKATVKAEIDAIADPQTRAALTLLNNRTWGAIKFMVRCDKSRATIGGE